MSRYIAELENHERLLIMKALREFTENDPKPEERVDAENLVDYFEGLLR